MHRSFVDLHIKIHIPGLQCPFVDFIWKMSRMKVYVYTKESGVYTVFYVEAENDFEIHYIVRCIEISIRRFGYIIEAVQC